MICLTPIFEFHYPSFVQAPANELSFCPNASKQPSGNFNIPLVLSNKNAIQRSKQVRPTKSEKMPPSLPQVHEQEFSFKALDPK